MGGKKISKLKVKWLCGPEVGVMIFVMSLCWLASPAAAQAATMYFSPNQGSHTVGQSFSVNVLVTSSDQAMNAVSGRVNFPSDKLEVTSVNKSGSIINLWVREPSFSNSDGSVTFEGIVLNPGYRGSGGKVISIQFRTRALGSAVLSISPASVLANDGQGTNILTGLGSASFGGEVPVTGPQASEASSPSPSGAAGVPAAPKVSSTTHPDPNKWYTSQTATFSWDNQPGITGINVLADRNPTTNPGSRSDGLRTSYTYKDVEEGVWYFHIRLLNSHGWGAISHFRFQIDTTPPPPFFVKLKDSAQTTNPQPAMVLAATDEPSGIAFYRLKIGDQDFIKVSPEKLTDNTYILPPQEPGVHTVLVQAVDQAGNFSTAAQDFEIVPLESPQLIDYPTELTPSEVLVVRGKTYPKAKVELTLLAEGRAPVKQETDSDAQGNFVLTWPSKLTAGAYQFSLQVTDSRGAKSVSTQPTVLLVNERPLVRAGQVVVSYLTIVITIISLLLSLLMLAWYSVSKVRRLRKRLRTEVTEAEQALHESFATIKSDIKSQLKLLDKAKTKRDLTREEEKVSKQLQRTLAQAEQLVSKEIEDIEKEVK